MERENVDNGSIIDAVARLLEWPFWVPVVVALLVWVAAAALHRRHEPRTKQSQRSS
ncbi:hypothetical protein [Nocardioides sp. AX2bis]|uniref:hypothetical protein n=1 Tax=Nocardioides sp. AX2bis TaxID=2653157 RepID=UPI0012EFB035|nr:hypothetical protein [Nocardioides sp. AX2bis]VXC59604.1 hypothetical protein NOCARDAX2BIS_90145 [Nocardioides sp. AX2bis]